MDRLTSNDAIGLSVDANRFSPWFRRRTDGADAALAKKWSSFLLSGVSAGYNSGESSEGEGSYAR